MNTIKAGKHTTEFWYSLIMSILIAVMGTLVASGLVSAENSDLIIKLAGIVLSAVYPVVIGWMATRYTDSRTAQKLQAGGLSS